VANFIVEHALPKKALWAEVVPLVVVVQSQSQVNHQKIQSHRVAPPSSNAGPGASFYTYDALKDSGSLPSGVDAENRELYLADDVFLKMFKMDKATFQKLPAWKKKRLKQKVGL